MSYTKKDRLERRHHRLRAKIAGTTARPRLLVHKSLRHIGVQLFDDSADTGSRTLFTASTAAAAYGAPGGHFRNTKSASEFGKKIGAEIASKGHKSIVFDRGGYKYHGVIKALADGAREAGLEF